MAGKTMFAVVAVLVVLSATLVAARSLPDLPEQVHINQGDFSGTSMVVSWITKAVEESSVFYDTISHSNSPMQATGKPGQSYSFTNAYTGTYTSGLIHHVNITGLNHSTTYYYKCGAQSQGLSQEFSFTTPPPVGPSSGFAFAVIGDLGQTNNSAETVQHVMSDDSMRMILMIGDLSYADSAQQPSWDRPCTQTRWDSWGRMVQPLIANVPFMALPGNHEVEQEGPPPATQQQFVAFQARFAMPSQASGAPDGNLYYSFEVASAHIIFLASYAPFDVNSNQYRWLVNDLKSVNRQRTPWLIAAFHAPWYNSNMAHHNEEEEVDMRSTMEGLFYQYKVDLVFSGHVHAYERSHPVFNGVPTSGAPTYITIGDGGNREGHANTWYAQPDWSAFRGNDYGHGRIEVINGTYAHWTWHSDVHSEPTISDEIMLVHNSEEVGGAKAIARKHWPHEYHELVKGAAKM